jgi:rfaE bifunctional protein kinase chain/domain
VGDIIADEFIYGQIARVSREAPVLILKYDTTEMVPGGGGNAANNVAALGGRARLTGIVGRDPEGKRLLLGLLRGVERTHIVRGRLYRTPVKTRILAGGMHSAKQQVVRIDRDSAWPLPADVIHSFAERVAAAVDGCDAVILSDYGSGLVTPELADRIWAARSHRSQTPVPILVDSRYRLLEYRGMTMCTPNQSEAEQVLGVQIGDNPDALERAGRDLLQRTRSAAVLITRGSEGMSLFEAKRPTVHIPIIGSSEVADVTGAGDTVIATVALALAAGASFEESARLANFAGGLVVKKRGTATISARELAAALPGRRDTGEYPAGSNSDGLDESPSAAPAWPRSKSGRVGRKSSASGVVGRDAAAGTRGTKRARAEHVQTQPPPDERRIIARKA